MWWRTFQDTNKSNKLGSLKYKCPDVRVGRNRITHPIFQTVLLHSATQQVCGHYSVRWCFQGCFSWGKFNAASGLILYIFVKLKSGLKKNTYLFLWKTYEKIWMAFLVIYDFYDLLMICYCFLGVPLFFYWFSEGISGNLWYFNYFIDFPQVFFWNPRFVCLFSSFFWIFLRIVLEIKKQS